MSGLGGECFEEESRKSVYQLFELVIIPSVSFHLISSSRPSCLQILEQLLALVHLHRVCVWVCMYVVYVHVCEGIHTCVCIEATRGHWGSLSIILCFVPLRQGFSRNLELGWWLASPAILLSPLQ